MQSLLINGGYHGYPGDRKSLIHLFNTGENSKDLQYKETDSQLESAGPHLQRNEELGSLLIRYSGSWEFLGHILIYGLLIVIEEVIQ